MEKKPAKKLKFGEYAKPTRLPNAPNLANAREKLNERTHGEFLKSKPTK